MGRDEYEKLRQWEREWLSRQREYNNVLFSPKISIHADQTLWCCDATVDIFCSCCNDLIFLQKIYHVFFTAKLTPEFIFYLNNYNKKINF